MIKKITVLAICLLALTVCTSEPKRYAYHVTVAGGPSGWPIWAEEISLDQSFIPGGVNSSGYEHTPPRGASIVVRSPAPAPQVVQARWFSYRQQKYYEVTFQLPEDLESDLRRWFKEYPPEDYSHYLSLGFSGKGEALAWWRAQCGPCGFDRSYDFHTPLIENVKAQEVPGDPNRYRQQTQQFINEGRIPASVLQ